MEDLRRLLMNLREILAAIFGVESQTVLERENVIDQVKILTSPVFRCHGGSGLGLGLRETTMNMHPLCFGRNDI